MAHSNQGCTISVRQHTWLHVILRQCAKKLESWLARHELAHFRRMMEWQSAAYYNFEAELPAASRKRGNTWQRRRIGRPPMRREAPMTVAWGFVWLDTPSRGSEALWSV